MTTEWLVLRLEEGSEENSARRFSSSEEVQEHVAGLVAEGVPAEHISLYSARHIEFAVAYKPVVNLSGGPADQVGPGETAAAPPANEPVPQGSQNGVRLSSMFKTD